MMSRAFWNGIIAAHAAPDHMTHRGWSISADYSCPHPGSTWSATSPDYDPDYDDETGRFHAAANTYCYAATYEELLMEIDAMIEEAAQ